MVISQFSINMKLFDQMFQELSSISFTEKTEGVPPPKYIVDTESLHQDNPFLIQLP